MESTLANSAQGLVIAPKAVLAEAQNVFTQIGAVVIHKVHPFGVNTVSTPPFQCQLEKFL
jgi:hypothetical protein